MSRTVLFAYLAARRWPLALLAASLLPLLAALVGQYGFGLFPCELCLWQRVPYTLMVALALTWWLLPRWISPNAWWPGVLALLLWCAEAGLALYHVGVEQRWWQSATGCSTGGQGTGMSLADLKAQIMAAPLVACDEPELVLFGLSMAGWNLLYAALAIIGTIIYFRVRRTADAATR